MAMERMMISMPTEYVDLFERGRTNANMTKSAYIRLLIAEHEKQAPDFWVNKELISAISDLNNRIKFLLLSDKISDQEILHLHEKMDELNSLLRRKMQKE